MSRHLGLVAEVTQRPQPGWRLPSAEVLTVVEVDVEVVVEAEDENS